MGKTINKELSIFFYFNFIIGLLCSRTMLTISLIGLVLIGLLDVRWKPFSVGFNKNWFKNLGKLFYRKDFLAVLGIFVLVALSGLNSTDTSELMRHIRVKLPFLILPIAFIQLPDLSKRDLSNVLYIFLLSAFAASLGTAIHYALDYEFITNEIFSGKPIPTPIHHIRFSLLMGIAIITGIWLSLTGYYWKYTWEKWLIIALTVFIFVFQHVLSVRSGLMVLYAGLILMGVYYIIYSKKTWLFAVFVPLMSALPLVAYHTIPSLKNKVRYIQYDLDMFRHGNISGFSDGQRLISWYMGAAVFKENKIFGTGFGDLKDELAQKYANQYPDLKPKMPHNQFLLFASGMGLIGLLGFIGLFFLPLLYQRRFRFSFFAAFYLIITLSFLFENTLSTAFGTNIYLFFTLVIMKLKGTDFDIF